MVGAGRPSEVLPGIFLGGSNVINDGSFFACNGITHVVSVCDRVPPARFGLKCMQLAIHDNEGSAADLYAQLPACVTFMKRAIDHGGRVYVHCQSGISRSPAIVMAYLMVVHEQSFQEALATLRDVRPQVDPNEAFKRQLCRFGHPRYRVRLPGVHLPVISGSQPHPEQAQISAATVRESLFAVTTPAVHDVPLDAAASSAGPLVA